MSRLRSTRQMLQAHLLRIGRPRFSERDKSNPDRNQEERKELAARERAYQRRVGFAEIFDHDSKNRVQDKKQSCQHSVWLACAHAHEPQNGEQNDPLEKSLVELRWMARRQYRAQSGRDFWLAIHRADNCVRRGQRWIDLRARHDSAIRFCGMIEQLLWKLHCPGNICDASIKFSVDEIGAAAKEQTNRRSYDQIIAQVRPRDFVPVRVVKSEEQQPEHPAVARHSAFPHTQDRQWLAQHFGFVEKDVTEPTTDDHTEKRAARDEVSDSLRGQIGKPALGEPEEKEIAGDKSEHICEPVPTRSDIVVDPKNKRIEIVQIISEHRCGLSLKSAIVAIKTRIL